MPTFIFDRFDWPRFKWDQAKITPLTDQVRYRQGRLSGRMEGIGQASMQPPTPLLQAILQHKEAAVTKDTLGLWRALLFPDAVAKTAYRTGPASPAPGVPPYRLEKEMQVFLDWVNADQPELPALIKAGIAPLWFLALHPFEDGNGRIACALADLLLARAEESNPHFSFSLQAEKEAEAYQAQMKRALEGNVEITEWLLWFLSVADRAIEGADKKFKTALGKAHFFDLLKEAPLNDRQRKMLSKLIDGFDGKLTTTKWAEIAGCSQDSALRDIAELIEFGLLVKERGGGRSTSYAFAHAPAKHS